MTDESFQPTIESRLRAGREVDVHDQLGVDPLIVILARLVKIILEEEQRAREQTA